MKRIKGTQTFQTRKRSFSLVFYLYKICPKRYETIDFKFWELQKYVPSEKQEIKEP